MASVLIVGTGFGGLCAGALLSRDGHDVTLLEKAQGVGGTWRENTYPGAECDVPSALYSYSFAPNPTWHFKWAKQPQILRYLEDFAETEGLTERTLFGRQVTAADWGEGGWTVTADGPEGEETHRAQHLVLALGQLHHPQTPDLPNRETYEGAAFHAAKWDHEVGLDGARIAVVGSAASAVQIVPALADRAARLTVYQRSPNWVFPKGDRPYSTAEKALGARVPGLARAYRTGLWAMGEFGLYPMIRGRWPHAQIGEALCRREIEKHFADEEARRALTPDFPIGAKRILLSDKYYPALARENVDLVTDPIEGFAPEGLRAGDTTRPHDVVVFATGFRTNPFVADVRVTGEAGTLREHWSAGAHAYLGVQTAGFPNLFFLYGPNTNTGHTSIVYKHEAQVSLIRRLIGVAGEGSVAVRPEVEDSFNDEVQARLADLAWSKVERSWYKDGARVTNNWPGPSREYRRRLEQADLAAWKIAA